METLELKRGLEKLYEDEQTLLTECGGDVAKLRKEDIERLEKIDKDITNQKLLIRSAERQDELKREEADSLAKKEAIEKARSSSEDQAKFAKKAFLAYLRGEALTDLSPVERAIVEDAKKRGQEIATDSKGGYLTSEEFSKRVIETLVSFGGMTELAEVMTTATGNPFHLTTWDDSANGASEIDEATAASQTEIALGRKTMNAYKFTSNIFTISNELLQDDIVDIEQLVMKAIRVRFGRTFNNRWTVGAGSGASTALGIAHSTAGYTNKATATAGGVITYDMLVDVIQGLDRAYIANGAKWSFSQISEGVVRKLKDDNGLPLWSRGDIQKGTPNTLLGFEYVINNDMPDLGTNDSSVAMTFGDHKAAYMIRMVQQLGIRRLNELYATSDEVGYVAFARMDGKPMDTSAVVTLQNAAP